ncbi:unnamed protein product [Adineta steineri]|uniref:Uncharacterized protein n=1 Tax=Adineta steineri TaxID=433720 RepID=A0A819DFD2_9BILA|nr:unnamed protein product [Adineta steineri]
MPFHMVIIQSSGKYYLAVLQQSLYKNISTSIRPSQECIPAEQLLNSTVMKMVQFRRIIFFHILCHIRTDPIYSIDPACFFGDECQFYTKGLGPILDEILSYELKRNTILSKQFITELVLMRRKSKQLPNMQWQ